MAKEPNWKKGGEGGIWMCISCWEEMFDGDCIKEGEKSKSKSKQKGEGGKET